MVGQEELVKNVLSDPVCVYGGGNSPWNTVFINPEICNLERAPVLVAVNSKTKAVSSAYFKNGFKGFKESMLPKDTVVKWRK